MVLFVNEEGIVENRVAATVVPKDGKICYGLEKGTKIEILEQKMAGENLYYKFDSRATKGVTIIDFEEGNLWVLADGEATVTARVAASSDLGSLIEKRDVDGNLAGFSLKASCPLDDKEGMARMIEIAGLAASIKKEIEKE